MKLSINEDNSIQLEKVYLPICLLSDDGEKISITMRDSGFEFKYQDVWYSAKNGVIEKMSGDYNGETQKNLLKELAKSIKA